jgi:hypothetical protein
MSSNLPARRDEGALVVDTSRELHADHVDPQHQVVRQNLRVAILPLAIAAFLVLGFVVAAWTFLAAG